MRKPIPMHVGEILTAKVKRLLGPKRMLIALKGHLLVAEIERSVTPGEPITVQVLSIFPRIHLRHLTEAATPSKMESPLDVQR
ncbi:hypothetical protein KKB28_07765 [bacterium]|nr:hypothetical protein [bacterium]